MKKNLLIAACILILSVIVSAAAWSLEAPGNIVYIKGGAIYSIQPDGRGEKKVANQAAGQTIISPDGKKIAYLNENKIYIKEGISGAEKSVFQGEPADKIALLKWLKPGDKFVFQKNPTNNECEYFIANTTAGTVKSIGKFYERPTFSTTGNYWMYSTLKPGEKKSEVYIGLLGEKGRYVYDGNMTDFLAWDKENEALLYSRDDKIYAYEATNRERQIINIPFRKVKLVGFLSSTVLYYNLDTEKDGPGLQMFNSEDNEQKALIEDIKTAIPLTMNSEHTKIVIFVPQKQNNPMGEGDLYLVETVEGKETKLTKDLGKRILTGMDMSDQWSPDGKYFVYEKIRMKNSVVKKSEIYIAGDGKDEKLFKEKKVKPFTNYTYPVWADFK